MSSPEDSEMSGSEDFEMNDREDSSMSDSEDLDTSISEGFQMSTSEDVDLECYCGFPAKLRVSNTRKNPSRLFYNCPKRTASQCGYFQWVDELRQSEDKHTMELNLIRVHCIQLQERLEEVQQRLDNDRSFWERERSELVTKISSVQAELDDIKKKIKIVSESELMPPLDKLSTDADDESDVKVIYAI